jgi:hypothetical protein
MTALLIVLAAALAYIVHERLDLARFNRQAQGAFGVNRLHGSADEARNKPDGENHA